MVKRPATEPILQGDSDAEGGNEDAKGLSEEKHKDVKKRIKTKSLYRQPTSNELNRLQETENLFNSNLFRLQIEEVLTEVKVKEKAVKRFKDWFTALRNHLLSIIEDDVEYDLSEKKLTKKLKVKLPVCSRLQTTKVMFKFHKFADIEIVGSYGLGCAINSKLVIDLQIVIPAEVYTKNDSINYKYHLKRAAYIAYVVNHLKTLDIIEELNYTVNTSETKPIIKIKPKGKLSNITVHVNFVCDTETYKLHRFSPSRNNLRETWLFGGESKENELGPPTPYYNSSILADVTAETNLKYLNDTLSNSENLKQAVVLLKIWVKQRKLQVSGYILSMLVAYLVQAKRINNIMSSYQIVRNVWIALKTSEWDTKGITLCKGEGTPSLSEFKEHFPVVFLDVTGYYNICWQMCRGTYDALRRESIMAVDMLDDPKLNSFIPLFMTPFTPLSQFDHILRLKDLDKIKESILERAPKETRINYGLDELALVTDTLHALLVKGLTNRVDLVLQIMEADLSWPVNKSLDKAKEASYEEKLSFGMVVNPENSMSIVDRGPPANLPEAEEFRAFWGAKSELRRFQDGAITEACVWTADTRAERRAIITQIVHYLLQHKYDISPASQFHVGSQLDSVTLVKGQRRQGEEATSDVLTTFDELRRDLRALTQLPLDISAVNGISPVFSYCEPVPACAARATPRRRGDASLITSDLSKGTEYVPVNRAVIELTHSGKWPGDLQAFRCLKAAFHLQIAERIKAQYSLPTQAYPTHLDVMKNGLVFRLEIAHPKEITLIRREVVGGVVKHKENEESVELQCRTVLLPRLMGALHGLHSRYPSFGPTACLLQRWASAQLLSPPITSTLCALLTAAVYRLPAQPTLALYRVLRMIADTDWTQNMLVVDFNDDLTREEISALERDFHESSSKPALHVVTAHDADLPGVWSRHVTPQVLSRLKALAAASAAYIEQRLTIDMEHNILGAFVPSLEGYDVLIRLRRSLVPHSAERLDAPLAPAKPAPESDVIPVVDFDPVQRYLKELRHAFGEWALFCHDAYGGDVIAVLWTPAASEQHADLQILSANALHPVTVNGVTHYEVNKPALIEDFRILGEGLVVSIDVRN
ncbi:nucleolar protein 6 [Aricia agestis]|uniref:nucleolar protein 6 n=1 Tax=Aricia agestis TaxID=91739 RepID=UPI001C207CE2|nr:nucleolar protein 6 [Aricia agestis]